MKVFFTRKGFIINIMPLAILLIIGFYFAFIQYSSEVTDGSSIFLARLRLLAENWYLFLVAILAILYFKFILPRLFDKF
jgi:hypothetical protein